MFWFRLFLVVVGGGLVAATLLPFSPMTLKLYMPSREIMITLHRHRVGLRAVGLMLLSILPILALAGEAPARWGWTSAGLAAFFLVFFLTGYVPVVMRPPPVDRAMSASEADQIVAGDTDVLGIFADGEARAYARGQLARPHIFTDDIGGRQVAITYCILCNTAMAFRSELDDRPLQLRAVSAYNNNIIYHDADSGDYIQQLDAGVISGPDAGKQLEPLQVTISSWDSWKSMHPESGFVDLPPTGVRDKMMSRMLDWMIPLEGLSARSKPWHPVNGSLDTALEQMEMVVGVDVADEPRAYPMQELADRPVINDTLGGEPIVVMYDRRLDIAGVFSRRCDGAVLDFNSGDSPGIGVADDRSRWDITGAELTPDGTGQGRQLDTIPHFGKLFWFSWSLFKPDTTISTGRA